MAPTNPEINKHKIKCMSVNNLLRSDHELQTAGK